MPFQKAPQLDDSREIKSRQITIVQLSTDYTANIGGENVHDTFSHAPQVANKKMENNRIIIINRMLRRDSGRIDLWEGKATSNFDLNWQSTTRRKTTTTTKIATKRVKLTITLTRTNFDFCLRIFLCVSLLRNARIVEGDTGTNWGDNKCSGLVRYGSN